MSDPYRISDGRMHGYRLGDLNDLKVEVKDLTDDCLRRILAPLVPNLMDLYTICVLGLQGSGKTEICKYIAYIVQEHYGAEDVNTVVVDNPTIAYKELDSRPIQLIIVDDAAQHLGSQSVGKREEFDKWFMIRHIAEEASGSPTGRVITVFNWQRYSSVHPNFRNPNLWLFSSPMADTADIEKLRLRTGNQAYASLQDNWDKVQTGDQTCKSNVIARLPDKPLPAGVGWFFTEYMRTYDPDWDGWPTMLRTATYGRQKRRSRDEILDSLRSDSAHELMMQVHDLYRIEGRTQKEIAGNIGVSQGQISKILSKVDDIVEEEIERDPAK